MRLLLLVAALAIPAVSQSVDPSLESAIAQIRAIDNHAHPVRNDTADREMDALPIDNMEPQSVPYRLRPEAGLGIQARHELFGWANKAEMKTGYGDSYPARVLDRCGIETMLANRVAMGGGIRPPHFLWVPFADALLFPLDTSHLAERNSDVRVFFADERVLLKRYLRERGLSAAPTRFDDYLNNVVTATLEQQHRSGAIAEKFEAAYLRPLDFGNASKDQAQRVYQTGGTPSDADYKLLQDFLFRYIARECGRLGMAVHIHTEAGAGSYFNVAGANPLLLEPVLDDPALRKTKFVMLHGGWPFTAEITALLTKPGAYLDFSSQALDLPPSEVAAHLREWLSFVPEKVLFGTDAYPYSDDLDWEESLWIANRDGRHALGLALTSMMRDGEITRGRAIELARMVLRDNARQLYGLK